MLRSRGRACQTPARPEPSLILKSKNAAHDFRTAAVYADSSVWNLAYAGSHRQRRVCMRKVFIACAALALVAGSFTGTARAQFKNGGQAIELRLPTLSQRAISTQRIGITDITVNYCRPLVGGREIWGKAVPYGQTWRAGANENTTISFTDDVSVEGHALPAGTYGLHTIPNADQW